MTIKFVWNGIKVDGELYKASYYKSGYTAASGLDQETITVYGKDYKPLPRIDGMEIENDTEIMTDYFENDRMRIAPGKKYYEEALEAYKAQELHMEKRHMKNLEKRMEKVKGTIYEKKYREEIERAKELIKKLIA